MNSTIALYTIRERFTSPIRIALILCILCIPLIISSVSNQPFEIDPGTVPLLAWVLGAGIIGREMSSGVLQIVFVRPVARPEYVFSKYVALSLSVTILTLLQWLVGAATSGADLALNNILYGLADLVLKAFGISAVIIFLSSLVPGFGDAGLYILINIIASLLQMGHSTQSSKVLARIGAEIELFFEPVINSSSLINDSYHAIATLSAYLFTVTLSLALAIILMNRKELSYATG